MAKKKAEPEKKAETVKEEAPPSAVATVLPPVDVEFERRRRKSGAP